jgi:signal transduction histidine kinase
MNQQSPHELMPPVDVLLRRYQEVRSYVQLDDDDIQLAVDSWPVVEPYVPTLIDDFYNEIMRHTDTRTVMNGGTEQVARLKLTLVDWIRRLFAGKYDHEFIRNRWIIGWRHVRIGLPQVWAAAAMSRLKSQLYAYLCVHSPWDSSSLQRRWSVIARLMDVDLVLIQEAYHTESVADYVQLERDFNEAIIGTTQAIVLLVDFKEHGKIVRGNRYLAQMVCSGDELPAELTSLEALIPAVDLPGIYDLFQSLQDDSATGPVVTRFHGIESRERTIRWFARRVPDPRRSFASANEDSSLRAYCQLLVGHDISDLIDAQRRMVQQERLAAIGQTMAGLAHESRNAFQRSQAALETLALDLDDRPDALQLVERIQRANDHLLHLYQEVLQFAKPVRLDLRTCHINDLAQLTCQHLVQAGLCSADRITISTQEQLRPITVDPYAVEQILRNLIENAIAVSPDGVPVRVVIQAAWQGDNQAVRVDVQDEGPGIPAEYLERIFEPFFSTRSRGTGLGLPIARRLAEAHGGSLSLETGSQGTNAILELPLSPTTKPGEDPENQPDHRRGASRS